MKKNLDSVSYHHEILEACGQSGCPFCRLLTRSANIYIDSLLWEMVNRPHIRAELNQARGYCHHHAWLLVRGGAALGVTILMQDVLQTLVQVLESYPIETEAGWKQLLSSRNTSHKLAADLSPQQTCPICIYTQKVEKQLSTILVKQFTGENSLAEAYQASDGLCLPHLRYTLNTVSFNSNLKALLKAQKIIWQRLDADLQEFIRKNDYRHQSESFGDEQDAWLRVLEAISGAPPQQGHSSGLTQSI